MKRLRVIWIYIILSTSFNIFSQGELYNLKLTKYASQIEDSEFALKEQLRVYFFDAGNKQKNALNVAALFSKNGDINNAIKYLDIGFFASKKSEIKDSIRFEKANLYSQNAQYTKAKIELIQISTSSIRNSDKYHFYRGFIDYFDDKYEDGFEHLRKISYLNDIDKNQLHEILVSLKKNKNTSLKWYQVASGIIPGMGQYIAGDFKGGLNSTLLNGGLIYLFFSVANNLSYADAFLSVSPWLMRYFIGGVGNAKKAARNKIKRKKKKYIDQSLRLIENAQNRTIPSSI